MAAFGRDYPPWRYMIISCPARSLGSRSAWRGRALARQLRCPEKQSIGGFEAVANQLADDYAIGYRVLQAGLRIVVPAMFVTHSFEEKSLREVVLHECAGRGRFSPSIRSDKSGAASLTCCPYP